MVIWMLNYRWKIFARIFGYSSCSAVPAVIGRIIREIILTLPRCLYFIYFHIAFISCEVIMVKCDIHILFL